MHFAVGRYVKQRLIAEVWGRGIAHIKLIGDLPIGSGALEEARVAAGYLAKYEHPLWEQALARAASESGAAGRKPAPVTAEFIEDSRLIGALQTGVAPDFDVYDAATWSAVTPLSERSVADHSRPADFPDFTRGKWKTNPPVRILGV